MIKSPHLQHLKSNMNLRSDYDDFDDDDDDNLWWHDWHSCWMLLSNARHADPHNAQNPILYEDCMSIWWWWGVRAITMMIHVDSTFDFWCYHLRKHHQQKIPSASCFVLNSSSKYSTWQKEHFLSKSLLLHCNFEIDVSQNLYDSLSCYKLQSNSSPPFTNETKIVRPIPILAHHALLSQFSAIFPSKVSEEEAEG